MPDGYYVSKEDREIILELLRRERQRLRNPELRGLATPEPDDLAPEVYVALIPSGGIAGLSAGDDSPASADCEVYRLAQSGAVKVLRPVGFTRLVYNISANRLPGGEYRTIERDKFGDGWFVSCQGCVLDDEGTGTGTGTATGPGPEPGPDYPAQITLLMDLSSCGIGCGGGFVSGTDSVEMNYQASPTQTYNAIGFVPTGCDPSVKVTVIIYRPDPDVDEWFWEVSMNSSGVDSGGPITPTSGPPGLLQFPPFSVDWSGFGGEAPCHGTMTMTAEE